MLFAFPTREHLKIRIIPKNVHSLAGLDSTHLALHLILIVMAFTTLAIFIEEIFYLRSKIKTNYRRRRMSMLQVSYITNNTCSIKTFSSCDYHPYYRNVLSSNNTLYEIEIFFSGRNSTPVHSYCRGWNFLSARESYD